MPIMCKWCIISDQMFVLALKLSVAHLQLLLMNDLLSHVHLFPDSFQVLHKQIYNTMKGNLLRRPILARLHLYPDEVGSLRA